MTNSLHNSQIGGRDPVTPIFSARAGMPARFRVLHPGGHARNDVFMLHGHIWQEMPYQTRPPLDPVRFPVERGSNVIARNGKSPWHGAQWGHGPSNHFDVVLDDRDGRYGAGGRFRVTGDYLYRTFQSFNFDGGIWGLFRVVGAAAAGPDEQPAQDSEPDTEPASRATPRKPASPATRRTRPRP